MTCVSFTSYREAQLFECVGHTGYGAAGGDILCSAVSCLCYTLDAYLKGAYERGLIKNYISDFSPGLVQMRFEYNEEKESLLTKEGIYAVLCGFRLLCESFPDYIDADI